MKIINRNLNKYQYWAIAFFVVISIVNCFQYYSTGFFSILYKVNRYLPIVCIILCIPLMLNKKYSLYKIILLFDFTIIMLVTIFSVILNYTGNLTYMAIGSYILLAIQTEKIFDENTLYNCFKILSIIGIGFFIYFFFVEGYDFSMIIGKAWSGYVWSKSFYYASILWSVPYFVILSHIKQKDILISTLAWITYIIWNLMFLKRFVFVDTLIIIMYLLFHYMKLNKINLIKVFKICLLIIVIGILLLFVFRDSLEDLLKSVLDRFSNSVSNLASFDRIVELRSYINQASCFELVLGGGFVHRFIYADNLIRYNLHIGWGDFMYHGGIILLILCLLPYFKVPRFIKAYRYISNTQKIYFSILVLNFFRYMYIGPYVFYPQMLITFLAILYVQNAKLYSKKINKG